MKKLLIFLFFSIMGVSTHAKDIKITNVRLEHNVMVNNQKSMVLHITMEAEGYKGDRGCVYAYIQKPKGSYAKAINSQFRDSDGDFCAYCSWNSPYDDSYWEDLTITIPNNCLPNDGSGDTYYFKIVAQANSDRLNYVYSEHPTYGFEKQEAGHQHSNNQQANDGYITCYACGGSGQVVEYMPYYGPRYTRCLTCMGQGRVRFASTPITPTMPIFSMPSAPVYSAPPASSTPPATSGSSSSGTNMQNVYQSSYNKTEGLVQDTYNMYQREKSSSSPSYSILSRIVNDYRHYQKSLRNIRNEAAKEGITISQSSWEYKSL